MTFLTPLIAAIAAGIAIPSLVILYFLKLRRREMEVSTTLLWKKAIQDMQANAPFQRLRRNILLILQLIVLAAALFAIAQPQLKGESYQNTRQIILIDRSASMSSIDGEGKVPDDATSGSFKTRFEIAKKEAKELVDALPEAGIFGTGTGAEAMIVAFDTTAEVRQQFTSDKALLKAAIDALQPTDAPTMMGEAMRLAKAHAPKRGIVADPRSGEKFSVEGLDAGIPVTIHIWSDGRAGDLGEVKPGLSDEVVFHRVGLPESANLGIVGLRWERSYDDPTKLSIFVSVQSTFEDARNVDVELVLDGQVAGIRSLSLPAATVTRVPGEGEPDENGTPPTIRTVTASTSGVVFQLERPQGAIAQLRLRAPNLQEAPAGDGLATDNRATLIVPPARKLAVAAVTRGNLFLAAALRGLPLAKLETLTPDEFEQRRRDGKAGEFDVVILDGWLPGAATATGAQPAAPATGVTSSGTPALPPGRYLILGSVPGEMGITDLGPAGSPSAEDPSQRVGGEAVFIDWMRDHPVLRNVTLDPVVITQMRQVEIQRGSGAVAMAQTSKGPGIIDTASSDGQWRAIVVPFDVADGNWAFDVSFVVFMASAVDYLGGASDSSPAGTVASVLPQGMIQPGSVLADRLPLGTDRARMTLPPEDGRREDTLTVAPDGRIVYGPVRTSGLYEVSWAGPGSSSDLTVDGRTVRPYAANLMDSAESDISSSDELALASRVVRAAAGENRNTDQRLWPWFLLGALAIVMLEWFIYNRKVHI
jgi:hypothetical protein